MGSAYAISGVPMLIADQQRCWTL